MTNDRRAQSLIRRFKRAFSGTARPPDEEVVYPGGLKYLDVEELLERLEGKEWRDLAATTEAIERHRNDEFEFLTEAAMRYYLPGYIVACLRDPYGADVLVDHVMGLLEPPGEPDAEGGSKIHDVEALLAPMTSAQVEAIAEFVLGEIENKAEDFQPEYKKYKVYWAGKVRRFGGRARGPNRT